MKTIPIYILFLRIIFIFIVAFFVGYYLDIRKMINNQEPTSYVIKDITCKLRSGSSIGIYHQGKYYSIGVSRVKCYQYNINDLIYLYYNEKYNYFYVPNTLKLYERYIYASILMVIFSFLPLSKFKNIIFSFLDRKIDEKNKRTPQIGAKKKYKKPDK